MGRGSGWSDVELGHLARSWKHASEDPIVGIDQKCARFIDTMFEKFKSFAPRSAQGKVYGARNPKSIKSKWDDVSADVQKFRESLQLVQASHPTGVTEDQILSMAIAKHLGKRNKMSYDAKDYPHENWKNHLAFKTLRGHPKFCDLPVSAQGSQCDEVVPSSVTGTEENDTEEIIPVLQAAVVETNNNKTTEKIISRSRPIGKKAAIRIRAEDAMKEASVKNAGSIAASLKRRTELMEEKNAMLAFSREDCETEEDLKERSEFLRMIRKRHMRRMRESEEQQDSGTARKALRTEQPSAAPATDIAQDTAYSGETERAEGDNNGADNDSSEEEDDSEE